MDIYCARYKTYRYGHDFYLGFIRYVDESICGKDLINYNGMIYVSMFSAEYPLITNKTLYDEIKNT